MIPFMIPAQIYTVVQGFSCLRFGRVELGCGDEWNRTTDTRIFSPLLYQLSYITSKGADKSAQK